MEFASRGQSRILEAQARRALGMTREDTTELTRALELFERTGAKPSAARVRCERGLLTGDNLEMAAGLKILESLGDVDQIARFELARRE